MTPTPELMAVEILGKCDHCGGPLPINHPVDAIECSGCQRTTTLGPALWTPPFVAARRVATSYGYDVQDVGRQDSVGRFVEWKIRRVHFACPTCRAEAVLSEDATAVQCPTCGWRRVVEPTPSWLRQIDGDLVGFMSDASREGRGLDLEARSAMKCMNCGASMTVDGQSRTVSCEYCSTANIIPDSLWSVFHPPRVKQEWWLAALVRNDPRRALPELPARFVPKAYSDGAGALVAIIAFVVGVIFIVVPIFVGAAIREATGAGMGAVVLLMVCSVLFLSFLGGLVARQRGRRRWEASRGEREEAITAYNQGLRCYLPDNEVVARITRVDVDGRQMDVEFLDPSHPETILGTSAAVFEAVDLARLGGPGTLLRGWFDRKSGLGLVSPSPSVLTRVGHEGLEPRDTSSLPLIEAGPDTAAGYGAYLITLGVLGGLIALASSLIFR